MPGTPFDAQVRSTDGAAIVAMTGDVDRRAQEAMDTAYAAAAASGLPVVLDFTGVDYINSTGIAVIVGVLARARAARVEVRAYGLSDHYQEIFTITRISDFMAIYDDEAAAMAV